jgi:hypothetical protein
LELITTTGRILLISTPIVGFKSTSQISPRKGHLILDEVATLCFRPIFVRVVLFRQFL